MFGAFAGYPARPEVTPMRTPEDPSSGGRAPLAAWLPAMIIVGLLVLLVIGIVLTT